MDVRRSTFDRVGTHSPTSLANLDRNGSEGQNVEPIQRFRPTDRDGTQSQYG
jgi:hypothetical protein